MKFQWLEEYIHIIKVCIDTTVEAEDRISKKKTCQGRHVVIGVTGKGLST